MHFRSLGRPLDYQLFCCFTLVGGTCAVGWRQFARWGDVDSTYLVCLAAGALAGALNLLRLMQDTPEIPNPIPNPNPNHNPNPNPNPDPDPSPDPNPNPNPNPKPNPNPHPDQIPDETLVERICGRLVRAALPNL